MHETPEVTAYTDKGNHVLCITCAPEDKSQLTPAAFKGQKCDACGKEVCRLASKLFNQGK